MKQILSIAVITFTLASCGSNNDKQLQAARASEDSLKAVMVRQQTIDSVNAANAAQAQMASQENQAAAPVGSPAHHHSSGAAHTTNNYYSSSTTNTTAAPVAAAPQKKGWSAKAKGAVIGAGAGAITGALVDKNKGAGALLGGIAGGAVGLGAGAIIDKKKKDKEEGK